MSKDHAYAYEAGYRDGSVHYELEHCPACKNVADLQEALEENAKLRELAHLVAEYTSEDQCEGCVAKRACIEGELDMCWLRKKILEKLRELGIDVDNELPC